MNPGSSKGGELCTVAMGRPTTKAAEVQGFNGVRREPLCRDNQSVQPGTSSKAELEQVQSAVRWMRVNLMYVTASSQHPGFHL